jgi:hypothetical protein
MPLNTLSLELPWLNAEENKVLERRFNAQIKACGCETGGYFTIAGIVLGIVLGSLGMLEFSWSGIGYAALIVLGFGFVGKTVGLIFARVMFFRLLREVCNESAARASFG